MRIRVLCLAVLVSVVPLPTAGAAEWGAHLLLPGGSVAPPEGRTDYWICVAAPEGGGGVVLHQAQGSGAPVPRAFEPSPMTPACRTLPGGPLHLDEGVEPTRLLVLGKPAREASSPGVVRLVSSGVAWRLGAVDQATELGVLVEGASTRVALVAGDDLEVVATLETGERRFRAGDLPERGVYVVLVNATGGGSALVDWVDPSWYSRSPTVGHVAVVVAVALFLMLYRGTSPRRLG